MVTQGPDIHTPGVAGDEPGGGTVESREPGKSGMRGWTERAGLTRYRSKDDASKGDDGAQAEGTPVKPASVKGDAKDEKDDKGDKSRKKKRRKKADQGT